MDVKVPNVDSNVNDTVGKKDDSPSVKRTILVNESITEHRESTSISEEVTEDIEQKRRSITQKFHQLLKKTNCK